MANTVKELKAKLEAAKAEKLAAINNKVETIKLEAQLRYVTSDLFDKKEIAKQNEQKLDALIQAFHDEDDELVYRPVYGLGSQVNKLIGLYRTALYSKAEHKESLIMLLNTDEDSIEEVLDALGNAPYYSKKTHEMVPGIKPDIVRLKQNLELAAQEIGLVNINMSKLTAPRFEAAYKYAEAKAKEMEENTLRYADESEDVA